MITEKIKKIQGEALDFYRGEGINFIPLRYKEKKPLFAWKKYQTVRLTEDEEDRFFTQDIHNEGVVCGAISDNLFVLDFDDEKTFEAYFPHKEGLVITKTGRQNGGYHVYFKAEESIKILKCFNDAGQEVLTVKGEASYVVGAGSVHPSGELYKFIQKGKIPVLKGDVREEIKKRARVIGLNFGNAEKDEEIDIVSLLNGVPEGGRDTAFTHLVHYLRRQECPYKEAFEILQKWNDRNIPPISKAEIYEKVNYHYCLPEPYSFFYKTNPSQYAITGDLEVLPVIEVTPPMSIEEVFFEDDKGKEQISIDALVAFIESHHTFKCVTDTQELLIYKNGIYVDEASKLDEFLQYYLNSQATIRFKAEIRKQIKDRNYIDRSEINADKTRVPVKNGLLNLNTFALEAFGKSKIYTSALNVTFDADAPASEFLTVLYEILPREDIPLMQEMFGYCLWQAYPAAVSFWLLGDGGNGKTTITNVLAALLNGVENVSHISLGEMDGWHRFAGYELYGKFANIMPEPSTSRALETPFLKAITGESAISVERKGVQKRVSFINFAKLIIEANSVPRIADEKAALWDRVIAIDFPNVFRGRENEIPGLSDTLIKPESLSGVLNWALEGLKRLRQNNWHFSTSILQKKIKTSMQVLSNPLAAFRDSWLDITRNVEVDVQSVYFAYELFCVVNKISSQYKGVVSKELQADTRITTHRTRSEGARHRVFRGCQLSSKILCAYGIYKERPFREGELSELALEEDVEVRTCGVFEYSLQYPEPVEEIQEVIGGKLIIFNSPELIHMYKEQMKVGQIKHQGPQEVVYTRSEEKSERKNKTNAPLFMSPLSPIDEGLCERCGKRGFLTHKLTAEEGESLICNTCHIELSEEITKLAPPISNTIPEEQR